MSDSAATRARLLWRCRRGMRELDEAMRAYLDHHFDAATEGEQHRFEELLGWQDPELYRLVCGKEHDVRFEDILSKIRTTLATPISERR